VTDLGESELPEEAAKMETAKDDSSDVVEEAVKVEDGTAKVAETSSSPPAESITTTTTIRQPLSVPASVHLSISADTLPDYLGPSVFQKERLYMGKCPEGVSNGLGYTGDGSGSVMPIEASVNWFSDLKSCLTNVFDRSCPVMGLCNSQVNWAKSSGKARRLHCPSSNHMHLRLVSVNPRHRICSKTRVFIYICQKEV